MSKLGVLFVVTLYFDISLLQSLRLTSLARQTGCCTLEILSSWPPLHWGAKHMFLHLGFYVSAGGLNSGPCAYTASTLWTELSPWVLWVVLQPLRTLFQGLDSSDSHWCHTAMAALIIHDCWAWNNVSDGVFRTFLPLTATLRTTPWLIKPPAEGRERIEMKFILELVRSTDERFVGIVETSLFTFPYSFKETLLFISEIYMVTREHMCALEFCLK